MLPAATKAGGMCMGMPDVCKVPAPPAPPIPTPFPNIASLATATGESMKVLIQNMGAMVLTSSMPLSNGDEAGVAGGVISSTFIQRVSFRKGSSKVLAEGKPMVAFLATTAHNGVNANQPAGVHMVPSQAAVLIAP